MTRLFLDPVRGGVAEMEGVLRDVKRDAAAVDPADPQKVVTVTVEDERRFGALVATRRRTHDRSRLGPVQEVLRRPHSDDGFAFNVLGPWAPRQRDRSHQS